MSVLVAGASRGLGFAIVRVLLSEGARVTTVSRDANALASAADRWQEEHPNSRVNTAAMDLSDPTSIDPLSEVVAASGGIDGLIVVAGSGRPSPGTAMDAWAAAASKNVHPALVAVGAARNALVESGSGAIVLVSSVAGLEFIECPPEYAAAKAALHAFSSHWSRELGPVRVNVLAPGNILTEGSVWQQRREQDPVALDEFLAREVTLRRIADPAEIARVAVFMVSKAASFMTGTTVVVDGGQVRQW